MLDLIIQESYKKALKENPDLIKKECNGCGPSGWLSIFIPNKFSGLDISKACNLHDWEYYKGLTWEDKLIADRNFLFNLITIINDDAKNVSTRKTHQRYEKAIMYFRFVAMYGEFAFISGKIGIKTKKFVKQTINKDKESIDKSINIGQEDDMYL
jgi:hypothetical protein